MICIYFSWSLLQDEIELKANEYLPGIECCFQQEPSKRAHFPYETNKLCQRCESHTRNLAALQLLIVIDREERLYHVETVRLCETQIARGTILVIVHVVMAIAA